MPELHYFPMLVSDWLSGEATTMMTPEQEGAFLRLLCHAWQSTNDVRCSLPDDDVVLAELSKLRRRWKAVGGPVRAQFKATEEDPSRVRNRKQYSLYLEALTKHERRVLAGELGGKAKASNARAVLEQTGSDSVAKPYQPESEPEPKLNKLFLEDFEAVWSLYPKRTGANSKRDAYFAYRARRKNGATADEIREGVERYAKYIRATGKEGTEYVKMAASFFGPSAPYLEEWAAPNETKPYTNGAGTTTRAMKLVGLIRDRRNPLFPNSVVPEWQTGLSNSDIQVCKTFGLTRILNDQNEGTMVAQLTKALEESSHG